MGKSVSHKSSFATQNTNTTGVTTSILDIDPDSGTMLKFFNEISTGQAPGLAIIMKLKDSNGNDLPVDTSLILRVNKPTTDEPIAVSTKEGDIASWRQLTLTEQRDAEFIDQTKIELAGDVINVRDKDTLEFAINSSKQIDWSNSELYVVREGVEEVPFEG